MYQCPQQVLQEQTFRIIDMDFTKHFEERQIDRHQMEVYVQISCVTKHLLKHISQLLLTSQ